MIWVDVSGITVHDVSGITVRADESLSAKELMWKKGFPDPGVIYFVYSRNAWPDPFVALHIILLNSAVIQFEAR